MNTHGLLFRTDYWGDPAAKAAFCDLARTTFGLDLQAWDAAGYWDPAYRPFTFFDGQGRAVSSVCLFSMELCAAGRPCAVGQVSTVATRPEWRRRGLARRLLNEALAWSVGCGHVFQYLFSDDDARALYRGAGFAPVAERVFSRPLEGRPAQPGARRLDTSLPADRALVDRHARGRAPLSRVLGSFNVSLLMFHALGPLRDALWYVEPLDVVVLARRTDGVLTLFDVVGREIPALADFLPFLSDPSDRRLVIRFEPDQLGDHAGLGTPQTEPLVGNNLHVAGAFPVAPPVVFPLTAQA